MKDQADEARKDDQSASLPGALATGGGNATAAGVTFQGAIGALFAAAAIADRPLDARLGIGAVRLKELRFETEAPLDDILIATDADGYVFTQAKTSLTLAKKLDSELGKTAEQIVRQWIACSGGDGTLGWNRPLVIGRGLFLIAVGPGAAGTVANDLAQALSRRRGKATDATTPDDQKKALESFTMLLNLAWEKVVGRLATADDIAQLLDLTAIVQFDMDGADRTVGVEILRGAMLRPDDAHSAFDVLGAICEQHMAERTGADTQALRRSLEQKSIRLLAPPDYRADAEAFRAFSEANQEYLATFEVIRVDGKEIAVPRQCLAPALLAAEHGSLLVVGEPGAGKSAVLNTIGRNLGTSDVLQLSVDRMPVSGLDGLRIELGLSHPIREVLLNWPGVDPAFLLIDSLDAVRGGAGELVFKSLIEQVLSLPGRRWRVIASVRSFDLRLGTQFRLLFPGAPPAQEFANPDFRNVRHIQVTPWTREELDGLLAQAPALAEAIAAGGERLRNLALVPFNTQLLADLIADGVAPTTLGTLSTQAELLDLYWQRRVQAFAPEGDACLRAVLQEMVTTRSLRAAQQTAFDSGGNGLARLLGAGVLVEQSGGRNVAFRHHILFDYAASRLYLNPFDAAAVHNAFLRENGLGLMLGPALGYALQEFWNSNPDRRDYWNMLAALIGDRTIDPIARSIAARSCSELSKIKRDTDGLIEQLLKAGVGRAIFGTIIGSLALWDEDHSGSLNLTAWTQVAVAASEIPDLVGSISFLLGILTKQPSAGEHGNELGAAARNLLEAALARKGDAYSPDLAAAGIRFVAETYATDVEASRALLNQVFSADRFETYAHAEVPALAYQIAAIRAIDSDFAIRIYSEVFSRRITSQAMTRINDSQIMPFMSHASQDYETARFQLAHTFPEFLKSSPLEATRALIGAMGGFITSEHPLQEEHGDWALKVGGREVRVVEDLSHIWAWDVEDAHPDTAMSLVQIFVGWLRSAPSEEARAVVELFLAENRFALLWTRLFMVGAERAEVFGDLLWELATKEQVLLSSDLRKDAVDLIAAFYPTRSEAERKSFEDAISQADFSVFAQPERARQQILALLFQAIGEEHLATANAHTELDSGVGDAPVTNSRPFQIEGGPVAMEENWWLREQGIDIEEPANASILAHAKSLKDALGLRTGQPLPAVADIPAALNLMTEIESAMEAAVAGGVSQEVLRVPGGALADGCSAVLATQGEQALSPCQIDVIKRLALGLSQAQFPVGGPEEEIRFERSQSVGGPAPRTDAARHLLRLCQLKPQPDADILKRLEELLSDPHPAVRGIIASSLAALWGSSRDTMWRLADGVAENESNKAVLATFTQFLGNARNADPKHVETLVLALRQRLGTDPAPGDARRGVCENLASLLAMLYVWNDRTESGSVVMEWCLHPDAHETELTSAITAIGNALVDGYAEDTPVKQGYRQRSRVLVAHVVDKTSDWLAVYYARSPDERLKEEEEAKSVAKVLDHCCHQLYFASGAFHARNPREPAGLTSFEEKTAFLEDMEPILRRIGDLGASHTIYNLLQILEFLLPVDPGKVFDLIAHALLHGGKRQGYQFDYMGSDVFVRIVGQCLADHRDIFREEARRRALVDCLDAFIEAGWPSARRLIYRLPELFE
jgi:hypothetical protein